jgi:hypothetical protein
MDELNKSTIHMLKAINTGLGTMGTNLTEGKKDHETTENEDEIEDREKIFVIDKQRDYPFNTIFELDNLIIEMKLNSYN